MGCNRDEIAPLFTKRGEQSFTTLQSGHLQCHSKANNGQAGVDFFINKKWKDHILRVNNISPRVAELIMCITNRYKLKIMQVYVPTSSYSAEDINRFYNHVGEILGKPNHYTIVIGDFNGQIGKRPNPMESATGRFGLELRKEGGDTFGRHKENTKS